MRAIKVLHVISSFALEGPMGGVARYVLALARAFDSARIELTVAGLWDYQTGFEMSHCARLNEEGIHALIAATWDEAEPYRSCVRALGGLRASNLGQMDLIHSHGEFSDLAAIYLARRLGAKATIRTVHNEIEWSKRPLYGKLFPNLLYPLTFDRELAISRQVAANLDRRLSSRWLGRQAQVVYNGIDFGRFEQPATGHRLRDALGIPAAGPLLGTIGRLSRQKGFDILLDAMPRFLAHYPTATLVIIGDGSLRPALEEQARRLGVAASVHFLGPRKDIEQILPGLDLFVSSSRWEGLPTVLLESVAARVPVVATAVSGTVEVVQPGVNGLLVPPEDTAALGEALTRAIAELPRLRAGLEKARQDAEQRFSLPAIARQLEEIYRQSVPPVSATKGNG